MKTLKEFKPIVILLVITLVLSCNNDDNNTSPDHELVGVWQRNDFSENFEYRLYLNSDNTGIRTWSEYYDDGNVVSSSLQVNWSTVGNELTLLIGDEKYNILYSFNSADQLILRGFTDFPFNKLE